MSDYNIYERMGLSIYSSYNELFASYAAYRRFLIREERVARENSEKLLKENSWLSEIEGIEEYRDIAKKEATLNANQKAVLQDYNRYKVKAQHYQKSIQQVDTEIKNNKLEILSTGEEQKAIYDSTHKTPYAILGMLPHANVPSPETISQLKEKYPEHKAEIEQALREVLSLQTKKVMEQMGQTKVDTPKEQRNETNPKEKNKKQKLGFKNFIKKFIAPALVVLGLTPAMQALPEAATPEEPQSEPKQTEKETFKEQLKVNDATISFNEQETVITPNDQFVMSQYRTTSFANVLNARANGQQTVADIPTPASFVTPTATTQPIAQQDSLSKFKSKIQNDEELRKIVDESLKYVAVQEKQGVSAEEKLDFIMRVIGANNVDVALGSNINYGGIKNQVLNMVNNVVVYYAEKETGKNGLWIRFEEEEREKPIVTADFSIIDKSGRHYVATTWDGIGNTTDTEHGTTKGINSSVAYLIKESKKLKVLDTYAGNPRINEHLRTLNSIMLGLNNVDDIIVSRNDRER